jgi:predicted metal-dependent peptidase
MTNKIIDKRAAQSMTKAVASIVLDDPFYGYLLLRREIEQDFKIKTACTNGVYIKYNPEYTNKLSLPQLKGLLMHEILHIANMHHIRRQNRDGERWNYAADLVINAVLRRAGVTLPDGGLDNDAYGDFSVEHAYSTLPEGGGGGGGGGGNEFEPDWNWGGVEDAPDTETEEQRQQAEDDVRLDVIQAANTAKIMGKMPIGLDRLIDSLRESKMPWRKILARFFRATAKDDESWQRPNRRYLANEIFLPARHSEAMGPLVIGVDSSGSVQASELAMYFGHINSILKHVKPESIHVVYCDAEVNNVQKLTVRDLPLKASSFKPKGGGGTDFRPVFDYVKQNNLKPSVLLYLTDMYGSFPKVAPSYPTIWCATTKEIAPFGKTLEIT